jgi:hypothetical protein
MGRIMSAFSDEKPINRKTYKFRYHKPAKPPEEQSIQLRVKLPPAIHKRVHKLAAGLGVSFSKAICILLDTDEAKQMAPPIADTWVAKAKQEGKYSSFNLFGRSKRHGNAKRISRKAEGDKPK